MSILKMRPKKDANSINSIVGYLEVNANGTPIIRRPVTASEKDNAIAELVTMSAQMWKMFNVAHSLSLDFCAEDSSTCKTIVKFER